MRFDISFFPIDDMVLALTAGKLAAVLRSGVTLYDAVKIVSSETSDRKMRRILKICVDRLEKGDSLSEALASCGDMPRVFSGALKAGEESGRLVEIFDYLRAYYSAESKAKKRLYTAVRYPLFLIALTVAALWSVVVFLAPVMTSVFAAAGAVPPFPLRMLKAVSDFFSKNLCCAAALSAAAVLVIGLVCASVRGRLILSALKLRLPVIGKIKLFETAAQFAHTVALLSLSGLAMPEIINIAKGVTNNPLIEKRLGYAAERIEGGDSVGCALCAEKYLPPMICKMAAVGEASGTLSDVMAAAGDYYDMEAMAHTDRALALLEPVLTVAAGLFAAFIVISVFVSVLSMYDVIAFWM